MSLINQKKLIGKFFEKQNPLFKSLQDLSLMSEGHYSILSLLTNSFYWQLEQIFFFYFDILFPSIAWINNQSDSKVIGITY